MAEAKDENESRAKSRHTAPTQPQSSQAPSTEEDDESKHLYRCAVCGETVDKRQLDQVLFHEDHIHRPDIQYGGSEKLSE
jgi:hypothetical protein